MKPRFLIFLAIISLFPSTVQAATISVVSKQPTFTIELGASDLISDITLSKSEIVVAGTIRSDSQQSLLTGIALGGNDGFVASFSPSGELKWNTRLGTNYDDVATSLITASDGTYWVLTASEGLLAIAPSEIPADTLNIDSITTKIEDSRSLGLVVISLWNISHMGEILNSYTFRNQEAIYPRQLLLTTKYIFIVGDVAFNYGRKGFLLPFSLSGEFGRFVSYGDISTSLRDLSIKKDGTLNLVGRSGDGLGNTKVAGEEDGVIINVSATGKIKKIVRSSLPKTKRSWESAPVSLLLGGFARTSTLSQATITKFDTSEKPIWNLRISSPSPALTVGADAILLSDSQIPGLPNWKPKKPTALLLTFSAKGVITAGSSLQGFLPPLMISANKELGRVILGRAATKGAFQLVLLRP